MASAFAIQFEIRAPFELGLRWHSQDRARVAIGIIPEIVIVSVAEDDKMNGERFGVCAGLTLDGVRINREALGFEYRQWENGEHLSLIQV